MNNKVYTTPENQLKRALRTIELGQYTLAQRRLERLLPLVQDDLALKEQAHLAMADACLNLRKLSAAAANAKAAIALNPENPYAHYLLGFIYSTKGRWAQAIAPLRQAVELAPYQAEYYRALGWALFGKGKIQQGQAMLEQALNMEPMNVGILTDLAMVHARQERFDEALTFARRASEVAPADARIQEVLATLTRFKAEFERLDEHSQPAQPRPTNEAEWRELIAATDDFKALVQLWLDLHPAKNIKEMNASLQRLNELWNTTPRSELGGRTPKEMVE